MKMILNVEQSSIKYLTYQKVTCVRGHSVLGNENYNATEVCTFTIGEATFDILDRREDLHTQWGMPVEDVIKIPAEENMEKYLQIGSNLLEPWKSNLIGFLKQNLNVFSWTPFDLPGINPDVIGSIFTLTLSQSNRRDDV